MKAEVMPPKQPMFELMQNCGTHTASDNKVKLVTDLRGVLKELGLRKSLRRDISNRTGHLLPLLTLVYSRKPTEEDHISMEGRGVYHERIPVGNSSATIYVKGIGSGTFVDGASYLTEFPGFPNTPEELIFDDPLSFSNHPRIIGTETLSWGFLEYLNAAIIFSKLSKKYRWQSVEEAIDAGVTIPIGVMHFKDLSLRMNTLLDRKIASSPHEYERKFLSWSGNSYLGSVGLIVPSSERFERPVTEDDYRSSSDEITKPEHWQRAARTLRDLLDMGIVYSFDSAHGQNLYKNGEVVQADNSDLVFLGDYKARFDADWKIHLSAEEQRAVLINNQFRRHEGMTPPGLPLPEFGISGDDYIRCQEKFWSVFLEGIVEPDVIKRIPYLMSIFREQTMRALSQILVEKSNAKEWEKTSSTRDRLLNNFDRFGTGAELDKKKDDNLKTWDVADARMFREQDDPVGVLTIKHFLETGDESALYSQPFLRPVLDISDKIWSIQDVQVRDNLVTEMSRLQTGRDLALYLSGKSLHRAHVDVPELFENRHFQFISDLITTGDYVHATGFIKALGTVQSWRLFFNHPVRTYEHPLVVFAEQLLTSSNLDETFEQIAFLDLVNLFSSNVEQSVQGRTFMPDQDFNIVHYAVDSGKSIPEEVFMGIVGSCFDDPQQRHYLKERIEEYENAMHQLLVVTDENAQEGMVQRLGLIAQSVKDFPEMLFIHNLKMAMYFSGNNRVRAQSYYQKAIAYYEQDYDRSRLIHNPDYDLYRRDETEYRRLEGEYSINLKERYEEMGFPQVAKHYAY